MHAELRIDGRDRVRVHRGRGALDRRAVRARAAVRRGHRARRGDPAPRVGLPARRPRARARRARRDDAADPARRACCRVARAATRRAPCRASSGSRSRSRPAGRWCRCPRATATSVSCSRAATPPPRSSGAARRPRAPRHRHRLTATTTGRESARASRRARRDVRAPEGGRRSSRRARCQPLRTTRRRKSAGKKRSSRHSKNRVGTSGHASSGHGRSIGVPDCGWRCSAEAAAKSGVRSWVNTTSGSNGSGNSWPVFGPPLARRLARAGHHRGNEHDQSDVEAIAYERCRESAQRLRHEHHVVTIADLGDHDVGVLLEAGRIVVARQVDGNDVVTRLRSRGSTRCQYQASEPAAGSGHRCS